MRWEDERYIRLYTRDTTDWLALSFDAQALLCLLLRKVDRAGLLPLGRHGKRGVAIAIGHPGEWGRLEPAMEELLADGCVRVTDDGTTLLLPNFLPAQEARASDKARQQKARETAAAVAAAQSVTTRDALSQIVTECHAPSHVDTPGHTASQLVTPSLAVLNRAEPCQTTTLSAPSDAPEEEQPLLVAVPAKPSETPEALRALWNEVAHPSLPRWQGLSSTRKASAAARLRERPLAEWRGLIERISRSPFCRGENDRGWKADPEFLLRPGTAEKVLEGKYDRPGAGAAPGGRPKAYARAEDSLAVHAKHEAEGRVGVVDLTTYDPFEEAS